MMKEIKIRDKEMDSWIKAIILPNDERPGWVQAEVDGVSQWIALADVHPADQVALKVESVARQRYEWVSNSEFGKPNNEGEGA